MTQTNTAGADAYGRDSTDTTDSSTTAATTRQARRRCLIHSAPASAPSATIAITTLVTASGLSRVPTTSMMACATGPGVTSMTDWPTDKIGDSRRSSNAARPSLTAIAAPAARAPHAAATRVLTCSSSRGLRRPAERTA
ncbi:hypothetical protein [Aeromicrobium sp. UC242_57]|uniref:hypothetical protein n=1 Tax=Aeromicrobium sp. UC242_57 TaxID=3374624 RepID=UPI0037ADB411